jgi:GDP-L-fucose synthase
VQLQSYRQQYGFNGIYLLPVNLYGPADNFNPSSSHVIPALIRKIHEAQVQNAPEIMVWGDGSPTREFIYSEDAARGIATAAIQYDGAEPVNLGTGEEISIRDLVNLLCELMDYKGKVVWQPDQPNGQPRRCLDVERAQAEFGFKAAVTFRQGLQETIAWYRQNAEDAKPALVS